MALIKQKSASVSDVRGNSSDSAEKDRRVIRTRAQIDGAFIELLHRRSYGNIRVSDITKKAGVGRATFYAHYSSKDDLLSSQFRRIVAPMLVARRDAGCPLDAVTFFAHVTSSPRIYKALMGPNAGKAPRVLRECIEERVKQSLMAGSAQDRGVGFDLREAIITRFVSSSLLAVIECWVESNGHESPQGLQAIFSNLVGGGLAAGGARASEPAPGVKPVASPIHLPQSR